MHYASVAQDDGVGAVDDACDALNSAVVAKHYAVIALHHTLVAVYTHTMSHNMLVGFMVLSEQGLRHLFVGSGLEMCAMLLGTASGSCKRHVSLRNTWSVSGVGRRIFRAAMDEKNSKSSKRSRDEPEPPVEKKQKPCRKRAVKFQTWSGVDGLVYVPCVVDVTEEEELLKRVYAEPWDTSMKRRVQHYGWKYDYKNRHISQDNYLGPLPDWLEAVAHRLRALGVSYAAFDQVIVNEYQPGQGIGKHIDQPRMFGDDIVTVSLGSPVCMDLARARHKPRSIYLEPRSALRFRGDARYRYTHAIPARTSDVHPETGVRVLRGKRVSLTFRTVISQRKP